MKSKTREMLASLSARVIALESPFVANPNRMDWMENRIANLEERLVWLEKNQPAPKEQFVTEAGFQVTHPDAHSLFKPSASDNAALDEHGVPKEDGWYWFDREGDGATMVVWLVDRTTRPHFGGIRGTWGPRIEDWKRKPEVRGNV